MIKNNLKQILEDQDMKFVELEELTGIPSTRISAYCLGKCLPRIDKSLKIAFALDEPVEVIWYDTDISDNPYTKK